MKQLTAILSALIVASLLIGCAHTTPKPNEAQSWGWWSYLNPFSSGAKARKADAKSGKLDESKKRLTAAVDDSIRVLNPTNSPAGRAAIILSGENVRLHGLPSHPIDIDPLISLDPQVSTPAWTKLMKQFESDRGKLDYIAQVEKGQLDLGHAIQQQNSSWRVTWWNAVDWIKNFITRYWWLIAIVGYFLFKAAKAYLAVANPVLAIGVNKVTGVGAEMVKKGFLQLTEAGENFQNSVEKEFAENPQTVAKIKSMFKTEHQKAQSPSVQKLVRDLTVKPIATT